jgi:hypothetical protein
MRRRHKIYVRKRRSLPSRALRGAARQVAEMPAWLKIAVAALILGYAALASLYVDWGAFEWVRLVGTILCAVAALVAALMVFENRKAE